MTSTQGRDYRSEAIALAGRDYPFEVRKTEFATFFISVTDLPGCTTEADTLNEALDLLTDAKVAWIATAIRAGKAVPEPNSDDAYSGKFVARIGKSTHRRIAAAARHEGLSLNAWLAEAISFRLGHLEGERRSAASTKVGTKVFFAPTPSGQVIDMAEWKMQPEPSRVNQC